MLYAGNAPAVFADLARQERVLKSRLFAVAVEMAVTFAAGDDDAYDRAEAEHDDASDELRAISGRLDWFDEYGEAR